MHITTAMLQAFLAVADGGGLGGAARTLRVAPATVSATVRRLERELGLSLFDRVDSGLVLNSAGHALLGPVRQAAASNAAIERMLHAVVEGMRGKLVLGVTASTPYGTGGTKLVTRFRALAPEALLQIQTVTTTEAAIAGVRSAALDAAVMRLDQVPPDLGVVAFPHEALVLVLPADRPATSLEEVAAHGELPFIVSSTPQPIDDIVTELRAAGIRLKVVVEGVPIVGVAGMVLGGCGASVLPEFMTQPIRRFGGHCVPLSRAFWIQMAVMFADRPPSPLLRLMLAEVRRFVPAGLVAGSVSAG